MLARLLMTTLPQNKKWAPPRDPINTAEIFHFGLHRNIENVRSLSWMDSRRNNLFALWEEV